MVNRKADQMKKPENKRETEACSLLNANKAMEALKNLDGWQLTDDHKTIYREFILQDFMAAIDLIDRIALIAEDEKHHPDIHLTQYRNLRIGLTTHDVGGLSEKDFTVALKIKELPILFNKHNNGVVIDQQSQSKLNQPASQDKPMENSRDSHRSTQPKQKQDISLALKKSDNKTKGIKMKGTPNRMDHLIKKA
jgi:4a-hydroxytetrahydrobiopterin dehydratase